MKKGEAVKQVFSEDGMIDQRIDISNMLLCRRLFRNIPAWLLLFVYPYLRAFAAERPNVLMIIVDDMNDWVGCLGGHPQATTPNIDRHAKWGLLFTNAHVAHTVCNPSRTAVLTGGVHPRLASMG